MNNQTDLNYLVRLLMDTISYTSTKASIKALEEQDINLTQEQKDNIYQSVQDSNVKFIKKWIAENPREEFQS